MKKEMFAFLVLAFIITISCSFTAPTSSIAITSTSTPFLPEAMTEEPNTPTPTQDAFPTFGPPLDWPSSLDEAWKFIEEGHAGYTFTECLPGQLQKPWISWSMVREVVAVETLERRHPCLEFYADDVARIIEPGGGYFPNEHRLLRVLEGDVFTKLFLIEAEAFCYRNQKPILACGDGTGKPIFYGDGLQVFLDWLAKEPIIPADQCVASPSGPIF